MLPFLTAAPDVSLTLLIDGNGAFEVISEKIIKTKEKKFQEGHKEVLTEGESVNGSLFHLSLKLLFSPFVISKWLFFCFSFNGINRHRFWYLDFNYLGLFSSPHFPGHCHNHHTPSFRLRARYDLHEYNFEFRRDFQLFKERIKINVLMVNKGVSFPGIKEKIQGQWWCQSVLL